VTTRFTILGSDSPALGAKGSARPSGRVSSIDEPSSVLCKRKPGSAGVLPAGPFIVKGLLIVATLFGVGCGRERSTERGPRSASPLPTFFAPSSAGSAGAPNWPAAEASAAAAPEQSSAGARNLDEPARTIAAIKRPTPTRQLAVSPGKRSVSANSGMVVSVNAEATRIGVDLLKSGGNAVDAAVAVALALAVTHPSAGNIGGGGFALVHLPSGENRALDFRESSPARLERSRFTAMVRGDGRGPDSVAIPGSVAGLFELATQLGSLPFATLVEPAKRLAEKGHRISKREATAIRVAWPKLRENSIFRRTYGTSGKMPRSAGDWLKLPSLAATLERVQAEGRDGFYAGAVATSIVTSLGPEPQIRQTDLASYRAIWREPVELIYRGLRVSIMPPPSAGGVALASSLAMLSEYEPSTLQRGSVAHAHLLLEIMRRAQADRVYGVTDPDQLTLEQNAENVANALDPTRWSRRCPIDESQVTSNERVIGQEAPLSEAEHTTHLAVIDSRGMAVSLTTTLSSGFGSGVITASGIVLNNSLGSFSGKGQNQPLPNRRTTSSMAPTLVEDLDGLRLVLGTPGGDTIPSTILQLLNSIIDYAVPLDEAVDAPRLHQSVAIGGQARMESGHPIPPKLQRGLMRLGHRFASPTSAMGHANSIALVNEHFYGYVDPREGGLALGWAEK
jgi:gamma-glutamyltranspeptidase / glutathione hydrolase